MSEIAFVSMPFGDDLDDPENDWTKLFEAGLKPLENQIADVPNYEPIILHRADRTMSNLGLKQNVTDLIEQSSFIICVLTTTIVDGSHGLRLSNPNVLWELGYAECLGKPVIILSDNESIRSLPVLAGDPNVCIYNHKLVQTAKSSEAPDALKKISRDLAPYVKQATNDLKRGQCMVNRTRATTFSSRDQIDIKSMIKNAEKYIDILTTNLDYFVRDDFIGDNSPFSAALDNGATVRIVTMDPVSVIAEYRAKQLNRGQNVPKYRKELRDSIAKFNNKFGEHQRFHLHIYNDLPLQITIRIDHTIITSIVTRGEKARDRIQVLFNLHDQGVTESFLTHFQSMYEDSNDVRGIAWVLRPDE